MTRKIEKISYHTLVQSIDISKEEYNELNLPKRSTQNSAGYDFYNLKKFTIKSGETLKIPTGIKVKMPNNEFLMIVIRSSLGTKYNIRLCNQVGIIDSDYYNNEENEGHIIITIKNEGDNDITIEKNDRIAQGIFLNYHLTDDDKVNTKRTGGFGSTGGIK